MSHPVALILLVDENRDCRLIFQAILAHAGHDVVVAEAGEEGLRLARELKPDLIITEFPIPVPGYSSLAEAVRADPALTGMRILSVSANALPAFKEQARQAGVDGFLTKPVHLYSLLREVERFISLPGAPA